MHTVARLLHSHSRTLSAAGVVAGFAILYFAARALAADTAFAGLSDSQVRTLMHLNVYGLLALLLCKALRDWHLLAWSASVLLATGEELHQLVVPFRCACVSDWLLNVIGISAYLLASYLLLSRRHASHC